MYLHSDHSRRIFNDIWVPASPRPPIDKNGRLKFRFPLKRLTVSNSLIGYEPVGEPASLPTLEPKSDGTGTQSIKKTSAQLQIAEWTNALRILFLRITKSSAKSDVIWLSQF